LFPVVFLFITLLLLLSAKVGFAQSGATVSASGSTQICSGNSVLLTINDAPAGASFQWMRNNSEISGAISESFAAAQAGTYTAILIFNNQKDTLNDVQINKRADASLNGSGATTINGQPYFKICASAASSFDFTNASTTSTSNTRYIIN
jgi:hypothetical protein